MPRLRGAVHGLVAENAAFAADPTDFRFDATTGDGAARIFSDDVNDQFGFTTDAGETQNRFDTLELFVEAIATDLYGADQTRDGAFNATAIAGGATPGVRVKGDDMIISGAGVGGRFRFDYADAAEAELAAAAYRNLFEAIADSGATANLDPLA